MDKGLNVITADNTLSQLSVKARLALALHCFERFCAKFGVNHPDVAEFLDYLWDFPLISTPEVHSQWESQAASLVSIGLGDAYSETFEAQLRKQGVDPTEFRRFLEGVVEIIHSGANDKATLFYLKQVMNFVSKRGIVPPAATHFLNSRFIDGHGWGKALSAEERDTWRYIE